MNKIAPAVPIALASLILVGLTLAGGCSIDEAIPVDVPPTAREHYRESVGIAVPPTINLKEARRLRSEVDRQFEAKLEKQVADHAAANGLLDEEIADGAWLESALGSAVDTGIKFAIPVVGEVPGGAILTTVLAGLGMWLVPRPGDAKRAKAAEDKGYDMGRTEAAELLKDS